MNYLNNELIELSKDVLTKKDRIAIFETCNFDKVSSVYAALQGRRKVTKEQGRKIQNVILKAAHR